MNLKNNNSSRYDPVRRTRHDREVLRAEDFNDEDLAAIAAAKVPDEYAHLDTEL